MSTFGYTASEWKEVTGGTKSKKKINKIKKSISRERKANKQWQKRKQKAYKNAGFISRMTGSWINKA